MELVKRQDRYDLYGLDGSKIASSSPNPFGKISKENCNEIFGVVDVEKIIEQTKKTLEDSRISSYDSFKIGFNKAMELNKDKLFTVEDIKEAFNAGWAQRHNEEGSHYENMKTLIQSLQQPNEIEVEIVMETKQKLINGYRNQPDNVIGFIAEYETLVVPKLDAEGNLILKRIEK
jgi:hypothetical protein